ncbi:MAG: HEPN domain-containing protein [Deltaproteobacteria bacterium]|jgi:HEPN domain-containing protein|nr:HEPN domain-containing protein [Deltaproteobacteria bacterium]
MSVDKNVQEALRWLRTAEDDLDSATILRRNEKFPHACFHAQQAGEKALKAVWYFADADPWGHSIKKLIEDLRYVDLMLYEHVESLLRSGMLLDRFYIPTRYPNGLPDLTPDAAYIDEDAETCIEHATRIVNKARSVLAI